MSHLCTLCGLSSDRTLNMIQCSQCRVNVHLECLGKDKENVGSGFTCQVCADPDLPDTSCVFCGSPNGSVEGIMEKTSKGRWAHVLCARLSPSSLVQWKNGQLSLPRSLRTVTTTEKCNLCNKTSKGIVHCSQKDCNLAFHLRCGLEKGFQMKKDGLLCDKHCKENKKQTRLSLQSSKGPRSLDTYEQSKRSLQMLESVLSTDTKSLQLFQRHITDFIFKERSKFNFNSCLNLISQKFPLLSRISVQLDNCKEKGKRICHEVSNCTACGRESSFVTFCEKCGQSDCLLKPSWPSSLITSKGIPKRHTEEVQVACLRGLEFVDVLFNKTSLSNVKSHAGDCLFLFRYIALHLSKSSEVGKKAWEVWSSLMKKWEAKCGSLSKSAMPKDMLVFAEAVHARASFDVFDIELEKRQLRQQLERFTYPQVLEFNPDECESVPYIPAGLCSHCGKVNSESAADCFKCKRSLGLVIDYQVVCHAIVWAGLFEEIGIPLKIEKTDCTVKKMTVRIAQYVRPYRSYDDVGEMSYKQQCYMVTHFLYVMSGWGRFALPSQLFVEELVFCLDALNVVIQLGDPEIAGELLQCLRLLGMDEFSYPVQRGVSYLLNKEKTLKRKGSWVKCKCFYTLYHAVYCGIVGIMPFPLEDVSNFPKNLTQILSNLK